MMTEPKLLAAWAVAALLLVPTPGLDAQISSDHGPPILELPASTAAQAMGNAPYLSPGAANAVFYHPAVLAGASGMGAGFQRYGSRATLVNLAAATAWWDGGVGLGLRHLSYQAPPGAGGRPVGSEAALYAPGGVGVSEVAASVGYGRRVGPVSLGLVGTYLEQRVGGERDDGVALALGTSVEAGFLDMGLSIRNLGPALELSGREVSLPRRVELGASTRSLELGPLDAGATGSVGLLADGEVIPALGVELAYWPVVGRTFIVRGGLRRIPGGPAGELSFGAAFQGDRILLEYAYQGFDGLDGTHRFGIGWR